LDVVGVIDVTERWRARAGSDAAAGLAALVDAVRPRVVGIAGIPGSGKTTLARELAARLGPSALQLSMDDFYLSRAERDAKGLRFRGGAGSHDLRALIEVLDRIHEQREPLTIPRYDTHADDRAPPQTIEHVPDPLILDGYFLGYDAEGYGAVRERIDVLVFLDLDIDTARARRFGREQELRDRGGGLSESDMQAFWDDVLMPGIERLVPAARANADVVISLDADQQVTRVEMTGALRDAL
jgi:pantothenate kinase-related protein Tda10